MENIQRVGAITALFLLLSSFGSGVAFSQTTATSRRPTQTATVVLAVDIRELTSLRDVPHSGEVFFNRIERQQRRANEYDLAIR